MRATIISCLILILLAAGCVESTWIYTLNPDGSGKVELDALLQPAFGISGIFERTSNPFEDDPDELARKVAGRILAKSEGVAAWKDVSSGIADDGRVSFKGTAYFADLAEVDIKGDPFPTSFLKPSLSKEEDGRLVLGLQAGDIGKESTGGEEEKEAEDSEKETLPEPTEEEVALGVKKGKVAYQTIKPIATAFLSTMRTEIVVRLPGEAEEISNFKRDEDGALRIVFDGPRMLGVLDDLAETDAAKWYEFAMKVKEEKRTDEEILWHLNELVFGEKGPVRAVVAGEVKPLFDYEAEVAEARSDQDRLFEELGADRTAETRMEVSSWVFSGGVLGSARTGSGAGQGWTAVVGAEGSFLFPDLFGQTEFSHVQIEISHVTYDEGGTQSDMTRVVFNGFSGGNSSRWHRLGGGLGMSFGDGDFWAAGAQALYGVGFFGRHAELYLGASAYLWFGERNEEFTVGVEADIRLAAGLRF